MVTVMGASGNIGSKLADLLLQRVEVRVIGRSPERLKPYIERGATAYAGDAADSGFLTHAFRGSTAVFVLIPPRHTAADYRGFQNRIGNSINRAIQDSGVSHVVNLSSQGAQLAEKTGPIKGLHDQEQRLNRLDAVHVLHLRPGYFMENLFQYMEMIRSRGMIGSAIRRDVRLGMIATRDISRVAAGHLLELDFSGKSARELLGPSDISLEEATRTIGEELGNPKLTYVQFPYEEARRMFISAGLSPDVSGLMVEMSKAINFGLIGTSPRTRENTTETTFEEFARDFSKAYAAAAPLQS